jgi:5,10-methylenetetrahydromethanopterin reductase
VFGIRGPRGAAVARQLGDGIITVVPTAGFAWSALLLHGTVLEPGEAFDAPRVLDAAGAGAAVVLHRAWEFPGAAGTALAALPGGAAWRAAIEAIPERERHLRTHEGHLTYLNALDRPVVSGDLIEKFTFTGQPGVLRERLRDLAARGVTEIAYQPKGPDIPRELTAFAAMAGPA